MNANDIVPEEADDFRNHKDCQIVYNPDGHPPDLSPCVYFLVFGELVIYYDVEGLHHARD